MIARIQAIFSPVVVSSEARMNRIGKNQINKPPKATSMAMPTPMSEDDKVSQKVHSWFPEE
jgi:hypothetical protein